MKVEVLSLPEVLLITPRIFGDTRGRFVETWNDARYREAGIPAGFVQDNVSVSMRGVLRGLHGQHPKGQGKLITVLRGRVFDVVVDVRAGSPRFGRWDAVELDAESMQQLWIPPGFLHGFVALEDETIFSYKCTELYAPEAEFSVRWDDPALAIRWPVAAPLLSPKDAAAPTLASVPVDRLPPYEAARA